MAAMNPTSEFREAMIAHGLNPPEVIEPGEFCRFPGVDKSNGNKAAWCKLFPDEKGGIFGDFSSDLSADWQATRDKPFTKTEAKNFAKEVERAKQQAEADRRDQRLDAGEKARKIWKAAKPAPIDHPYLVHKNIKPNGARTCNGDLVIAVGLVPVTSLQFIKPDGQKRFLPGGEVDGGTFLIGKMDGAKVCCICEGFSTGASVFEATGYQVLVAFNANNLLAVAKQQHEIFPDIPIVICGDDDWKTQGNPGLTKAREAALAVDGKVAVPNFGPDRPDGSSDFNDLAKHCGAEAVKRAIDNAVPEETFPAPAGLNHGLTRNHWPPR